MEWFTVLTYVNHGADYCSVNVEEGLFAPMQHVYDFPSRF